MFDMHALHIRLKAGGKKISQLKFFLRIKILYIYKIYKMNIVIKCKKFN